MESIKFTVYSKIVQWKRVKSRFDPVKKKIISNNVKDQVIFTNLIKEAYKNIGNGEPFYFGDDVPIRIKVDAYFHIPKSMPKKYQKLLESGEKIRRLRTPDDDNLFKMVADSLNKVAYGDDKQCSCECSSYWTLGAEHLEIEITQENCVAW